jgi:ubiquinone/menaquinone biosynthesis C-methylase UbiE
MLEGYQSARQPHVADLICNFQRFDQSAVLFDKYRPRPPAKLLDILTKMARIGRCRVVVDMGCGTGLSTRIWSPAADTVIGIEPADNMRGQAKIQTPERNVFYQKALSHKTALPDSYADIVTCSQSLHWMEPYATFAEVARITRRGGVFAAYIETASRFCCCRVSLI